MMGRLRPAATGQPVFCGAAKSYPGVRTRDGAQAGQRRSFSRVTKYAVTVLLFLALAGALSAVDQDIWAFSLDFTDPPERNLPEWKRGGEGEAILDGGKLRLKSTIEGGIAYSLAGSPGSAVWDGTKPSTIQFKVRVIESVGGDTAAHVGIRAESRYFLIPISATEETTYRFLFTDEGPGRLFVNGEEQPEIKARPMPDRKPTNAVMFGDLGSSTGGETEWSEFRWTNEGVFEP